MAAFHVVTRIDASGKGKQKSKFSLMKLKVVKKGCGIHQMKFGLKF